ncbi:hypothetical protein ACFQ0Q_07710 [Streptomyces aureus]
MPCHDAAGALRAIDGADAGDDCVVLDERDRPFPPDPSMRRLLVVGRPVRAFSVRARDDL